MDQIRIKKIQLEQRQTEINIKHYKYCLNQDFIIKKYEVKYRGH